MSTTHEVICLSIVFSEEDLPAETNLHKSNRDPQYASLKKVFQKSPNQNIYQKNLIKRDPVFAYKSSLFIYFDIQGNSRENHYSYIVNNVVHIGGKT